MKFTCLCFLVSPVDSLCLDGPGWEDRAKHPFDVIYEVCAVLFGYVCWCSNSSLFTYWVFLQFASEESQHGPLILFLKDVEKMCGNSYSYHGLKNKIESFPAGVFIVGSQIHTDSRKDKVLLLVRIIITSIILLVSI